MKNIKYKLLYKLRGVPIISLSIRIKILCLTLMMGGILFFIGLWIFNSLESQYENYAYDIQSSNLNASILLLESKMQEIEELTYDLISNDTLQKRASEVLDSMEKIKGYDGENGEYILEEQEFLKLRKEKNIGLQGIQQTIMNTIYKNPYLESAYYINNDSIAYFIPGRITFTLEEEFLKEIEQLSRQSNGSAIYVSISNSENQNMIISRAILERKSLTMKYVGTVLLIVNMEALTNFHTSQYSNLIILNERGEQIFAHYVESELDRMSLCQNRKFSGYSLQTTGEKKYFVSYNVSDILGWTYINLTEYDVLFDTLGKLKSQYSYFFLLSLGLMLVLFYKFANSIIKPVRRLVKSMHQIAITNDRTETINLKDPLPRPGGKCILDEIDELQLHFNTMINHINYLINVNYKQDLMMQKAQFEMLQAQINPHFLYNTLDTIRWLATEESYDRIPKIITNLGNILRRAMDNKRSMIPLGDEVDCIRSYIAIQKVRFGKKLKLKMIIPEDCMDYLIPVFSIQPLIENVIKHVVEQSLKPCEIYIKAEDIGNDLIISISDNGPGIDKDILHTLQEKGNGIGLFNIDQRLKSLYGISYGITIAQSKDGGAKIILTLKTEYQ